MGDWTIWGTEKEPIASNLSETDAKEMVEGSVREDLYIQNDVTGVELSYMGGQWVEE